MCLVATGVTLVLSPGYLTERNFTNQLLCLWNISCSEDEVLFLNYTESSDLATQSPGNGIYVPPAKVWVVYGECVDGSECGGEYVMVEWEEGREVRCGEQNGPRQHNKVFPHNLKVSKVQ